LEKSEIRKDYFLDKYVIIAPKRAKRPKKIQYAPEVASTECFFCPKNLASDEIVTYEHKNSDDKWDVIALVNRYSALSLENVRAYGQQEVIVETRDHNRELHEMAVSHIVEVFDACIDRFEKLRAIPKIKHVIVFKNEGGKAGASVSHSHTQIIALPIVPPKVEEEASAYNKYRLEKVNCPYCDIMEKEKSGSRVIWEDDNFFVLAPYASETPYAAWFLPKKHVSTFSELSHEEKESLATALKIVLAKLDELGISYNYFFENAVNNEDYHTHLKLSPRPNIWAGLELGTGVLMNSVPPEEAAKIYREK
jgi:UDPglucose--hexose-1-phosphate uridylyltransferase